MKPVATALALSLLACGHAPLMKPPADAGPIADWGAPGADAGVIIELPDAGPAQGATVASGAVTFRVWAPHATAAFVEGDFTATRLTMTPEAGGLFSAVSADAHAGSHYRFVLGTGATELTRLDPRCRELTVDRAWCVVSDPAAFAWTDEAFVPAPRERSVVYELHVGSFSVPSGADGGTFASATAQLDSLEQLGVNVIELMPVQDFGGKDDGWGYNPQLYLAPKPSYGTADELRAFVDAAHAHGIGVWLDVVYNHMDGWRQAPLACFDGTCPASEWGVFYFPAGNYMTTPWGPRPNYLEPEVTNMLWASETAWLEEFHGNGFRFDSVSNIRALDGNGTTPGGKDFLTTSNAIAHAHGALTTAEDLKGYAAITAASASGGFGFDSQWDGFGYDVANQLVPYSDDARDLGVLVHDLQGSYGGDGFARLIWTEDHDTVGNGGARIPSRVDPADAESFAARRRSMLGAVLLMTTPGVPMLFMGQEALATGGFTDPPAPLATPTPRGLEVRAFYQDLIALRRDTAGNSGALSEGSVDVLQRNDANKVLAYRRSGPSGEDVLVIVNLRNKAYTSYLFGVPSGGDWRVRLDADWTTYGSDFGGGQTGTVTATSQSRDGQPFTLSVKLPAYGAVILTR